MRPPRPSLVFAVLLASGCAAQPSLPQDLIADVRQWVARNDIAGGERVVAAYRAVNGANPEALEAMSVLAQGALAAKQLDTAEALARQTYDLAQEALQDRRLDQEPRLPVALGRAIEIVAQVSVQRGARADALRFLERELTSRKGTSIEKRIQKNINVLTLEGTVAPSLDLSEQLGGSTLTTSASLKGKVVLMFFWAHWCADCKAQSPILASLLGKYGAGGLAIVAPTQRYGYVAGGESATPAEETPYIASVRQTYYPVLAHVAIPLADANHLRYGVSSTPTLVLVDRQGIVRLYHPGRMTEAELEPIVQKLLEQGAG